jgi:hypothetical protein
MKACQLSDIGGRSSPLRFFTPQPYRRRKSRQLAVRVKLVLRQAIQSIFSFIISVLCDGLAGANAPGLPSVGGSCNVFDGKMKEAAN